MYGHRTEKLFSTAFEILGLGFSFLKPRVAFLLFYMMEPDLSS